MSEGEKPKMGRPSKYDPKYCDEIVAKMSEGYSMEAFAGSIGVSKPTIYAWMTKYPEFLNAQKRGLMASQNWWEQQGIKNMRLGHMDGSFNSAIWIFNMKNRFGWRDSKELPPDEGDESKTPNLSECDSLTDEQVFTEYMKRIKGGE